MNASETQSNSSLYPLVRQKRKHKNEIRFNCTAFVRLYYSRPANCYNCMRRNGYPQNLGGDENCKNYSPNSEIRRGDLSAPINPQSESPSPSSNG